jgi:hypothetical protein
VIQNKSIKYAFKANADLVIRMHFDHDYSAEDICLRLRYDIDNVNRIIERYKIENGFTQLDN